MRGEQDRQIDGALDAVDRMMGVVDTFEEYVISSHYRDMHGTRYRLNLLWIHSFAAVLMAPLISLTGQDGLNGPSLSFIKSLPGSPYSLSAILGAGGLVLGWGCIFRLKRVEMTGLVGLACFYLLFGMSLAVPPIRWVLGDVQMKPPLYATIVYLHLTVIMLMHIRGLVLAQRDDAQARRVQEEARSLGRDVAS